MVDRNDVGVGERRKINTRGLGGLDACARFRHSGQLKLEIVQTGYLRMRALFSGFVCYGFIRATLQQVG